MKKTLPLILSLILMIACLLTPACAEEEEAENEESWASISSAGMQFDTRVYGGKRTAYDRENGALTIYAGEKGAVPYVRIFRRQDQLKNPEDYLNRQYAEAMIKTYGETETEPCADYEIGGKKLLMARYHFADKNGRKLTRMICVERREDGDVEYHAIYPRGEESTILKTLEETIRWYSPWKEPEPVTLTGRTVSPLPIPENLDTENGEFPIMLEDLKQVGNGYFTAALYWEDRYAAAEVESLQPGDQVVVHGKTVTIGEIDPHDGEYEILSPDETEFSYCVFEKAQDGNYIVVMDDWTPVTLAARVRVDFPPSENTIFYDVPGGMDPVPWTREELLDMLTDTENGDTMFSPYNTTATIENGLITGIYSYSYPYGPEAD